METMKEITTQLTEEQSMILFDKIKGFSLKEIADNHGIKQKRVYTQFNKVKRIVADVMEIQKGMENMFNFRLIDTADEEGKMAVPDIE